MLNKLITKLVGSRNDRLVRKMAKAVQKINDLEESTKALSDDDLKAKTLEYRQRHENGESLEALLPEAFALVREASWRTLELRHYDVQLIGGMVLHQGKIAEMKTGEGKTLMATLAVYLNTLTGKSAHVVTVNEYLARRDAEWMKPIYEALGLTVGVAIPGMTPAAKRAAYACDVVYATNNELGFDYLRDNMAFSSDQKVQRDRYFAIVDEVDSILIDEARTPLIISGPADETPQLYVRINQLIPNLKRAEILSEEEGEAGDGDFTIDEKQKQVYLTEDGMAHVEDLMVKSGLLKDDDSLYNAQNLNLVHHLNAGLRAHHLFNKDVDYIIKDGEIVIVDEFTGRTLAGRRWSEGLHQAIEAKEGVPIQRENQTLASITFQNYFRLYDKLSGMTGTADTEAYEFQSIYGLEVVVIPTAKPMIRDDKDDLVFLKEEAKFDAIIDDIKDCVKRGQPVLVGTTSIETSELLSGLLKKRKIKHEVLNAKQHEREAAIVENAGRPEAVTIATNMAGRGTDIVLGGSLAAELAALPEDVGKDQREAVRQAWQKRHEQVVEAGGLHIIGTERHESRRIDNQLRGRSGRQGDPGSSRFYLSLEDNLMRIFASDRMSMLMQRFGMKEDEAIEAGMLNRAIENAQRKVEAHNFDVRKHLLDYDDVANDQRRVIYQQRNELMEADEIGDTIMEMRHDVFNDVISQFIPPGSIDEQWEAAALEKALDGEFGIDLPITAWLAKEEDIHEEVLRERIVESVDTHFTGKEEMTGIDVMRHFEKALMLNVLDQKWKDHLASMDYLRQGIGLRGYAQKQPMQEYKRESYEMFTELLDNIKHEVVRILARVQVQAEEDVEAVEARRRSEAQMEYRHDEASPAAAGPAGDGEAAPETYVREGRKVGRNEPCPCGSGNKYKHCHGKLS
ncbi:MAG: preprotein translocase subunit SecA [Xanthomonadales bacterium]|nr:preprotein translocase subunit SecA [Gammaproteobacteria bacterium]MBT8052579.1 preprotein translocase subunit SecA [Gammaproteobacteria bacterium]NND56662.1 preprotein translocase subunit SecA [Xanthomonadales bacterium]NNK52396.1 preprotein translocase subunit SecA [Xanthomonadales bacterium]